MASNRELKELLEQNDSLLDGSRRSRVKTQFFNPKTEETKPQWEGKKAAPRPPAVKAAARPPAVKTKVSGTSLKRKRTPESGTSRKSKAKDKPASKLTSVSSPKPSLTVAEYDTFPSSFSSSSAHRTNSSRGGLSDNVDEDLAAIANDSNQPFNKAIKYNGDVQVLCILRYIPCSKEKRAQTTQSSASAQPHATKESSCSYDLILSTGFVRFRVALSESHNDLVTSGLLRDLSILRLTHVTKLPVGKLSVGTRVVIMVQGVEVLQTKSALIDNTSNSDGILFSRAGLFGRKSGYVNPEESNDNGSNGIMCSRPLLPSRYCYIPLSNNDCLSSAFSMPAPYSSLTATCVRSQCEFEVAHEGIHTLVTSQYAQLCASQKEGFTDSFWQTNFYKQPPEPHATSSVPTIKQCLDKTIANLGHLNVTCGRNFRSLKMEHPCIGYVIQKEAPNYFADPYAKEKDPRWPVQFVFYMSDGSKVLRVVCWGENCHRYFETVQVGLVVMLKDARLKLRDGQLHYIEVAVNPNENTRLQVLSIAQSQNTALRDFEAFDMRSEEFCAFQDMRARAFENGRERGFFTLAGTLTYVGRREVQVQDKAPFKKYEARWVRILDESSAFFEDHGEICLLLFANANTTAYLNMQPGDRIAVSSCRMHASISAGCDAPLSICFSTSKGTGVLLNQQFANQLADLYVVCFGGGQLQEQQKVPMGGFVLDPPEPLENVEELDIFTLKGHEKRTVHEYAKILLSNASRELGDNAISQRSQNVKSTTFYIGKSKSVSCRPVSLMQGRSFAMLKRRFPPCSKQSISQTLDTRDKMELAETRHYIVEACISVVELVKNPETKSYELRVALSDSDPKKEAVLHARCCRDPIIGPLVPFFTFFDSDKAKEYFNIRLRGLAYSAKNESVRTAQNPKGKESPQLFLIELHKYDVDKVSMKIRATFDCNTNFETPAWMIYEQ